MAKLVSHELGSREDLIAKARGVAESPCNCLKQCGDADDEVGVCIGLPLQPEPPYLPEVVLVHRDERETS